MKTITRKQFLQDWCRSCIFGDYCSDDEDCQNDVSQNDDSKLEYLGKVLYGEKVKIVKEKI